MDWALPWSYLNHLRDVRIITLSGLEDKMESTWQEIKFTDADVVNPDDFIPSGKRAYNPHYMRPWLLHDHGFCVCVVFARNLQDALDEAAYAGKLDQYMIDLSNPNDREDYLVKDVVRDLPSPYTPGYDPNCPVYIDTEGGKWWWKKDYEPMFLGHTSEPFDIEGLGILVLSNPPFSFCALFNANKSETQSNQEDKK